jgi:NAD(P)-dependent dehydrogenase (short-subunit alcohol dehydrogenase family)
MICHNQLLILTGQAKTANVLFSLGLCERLYEKHGILSIGLHPGGILTELARHTDPKAMQEAMEKFAARGFKLKTLEQGASTTLTAALDPKLSLPVKNGAGKGEDVRTYANKAGNSWEGRGAYLSDCQIAGDVPLWTTSWDLAEKLWTLSENLVGEKFGY